MSFLAFTYLCISDRNFHSIRIRTFADQQQQSNNTTQHNTRKQTTRFYFLIHFVYIVHNVLLLLLLSLFSVLFCSVPIFIIRVFFLLNLFLHCAVLLSFFLSLSLVVNLLFDDDYLNFFACWSLFNLNLYDKMMREKYIFACKRNHLKKYYFNWIFSFSFCRSVKLHGSKILGKPQHM